MAGQTELDTDVDFEAASPIYSVNLDKKTPPAPGRPTGLAIAKHWGRDILPMAFSALANEANEARVNEGLTAYLEGLNATLPDETGMLVQIRMLSDDFGNNYVPPDFLGPIGAGMDPVDAYSEFLNRPVMRTAMPSTTFRESSFFVWIEKKTTNVFMLGTIPQELTSDLLRQSTRLAMEKVRLNAQGRPYLTFSTPDYAARAQYWAAKLKESEKALQAKGNLARAKALQARFASLQAENDALVRQYEEYKRRLAGTKAMLDYADLLINLGSTLTGLSSPGPAPQTERMSVDRVEATAYANQLETKMSSLSLRINTNVSTLKETDDALTRLPDLM